MFHTFLFTFDNYVNSAGFGMINYDSFMKGIADDISMYEKENSVKEISRDTQISIVTTTPNSQVVHYAILVTCKFEPNK